MLGLWAASEAVPTHTDDIESLTRLMAADPEALVVAVDNGIIVGSVVAGWDVAWIDLSVGHRAEPQASRAGAPAIGLWRTVPASPGCDTARCHLVCSDDRAIGFWRSTGWFEQPDRVRFVKG